MKDTNGSNPEALAAWCRAVLRFLAERGHLNEQMRVQLEGITAQCVSRRDTRGLKQIQRDFREMTRGLGRAERDRLDEILSALNGPTTIDDGSEIATILTRGTVQTEDEYRLLMSRVDEIFQDPTKKDEVEAINVVLARSKFQ